MPINEKNADELRLQAVEVLSGRICGKVTDYEVVEASRVLDAIMEGNFHAAQVINANFLGWTDLGVILANLIGDDFYDFKGSE